MNKYLENSKNFVKEKYNIFADGETKAVKLPYCEFLCLKREKSVYFQGKLNVI